MLTPTLYLPNHCPLPSRPVGMDRAQMEFPGTSGNLITHVHVPDGELPKYWLHRCWDTGQTACTSVQMRVHGALLLLGHQVSWWPALLCTLRRLLWPLSPDQTLVPFKKCVSYIYFVFVLIAQNTKRKGWAAPPKLRQPSGGPCLPVRRSPGQLWLQGCCSPLPGCI